MDRLKTYLIKKIIIKIKTYNYQLFKTSLAIASLPSITISILMLSKHLSQQEGFLALIAIFVGGLIFASSYIKDINVLTKYVEELSFNHKPQTPNLSLLSNIGQLTRAIRKLHTSWEKRNVQIELALAEISVLFDILPDPLLMLDEELSIIRANNSALKIFGENILNSNIQKIIANPESKLISKIKKVINTGKVIALEDSNIIDHRKIEFRISIKKFPVYSPGGIASILVFHDITDSKRTRQMMKDFVANASHEIRTPLTSVLGFIEMLQTMDENDKTNRDKFLQIMEQQANHMAILVNDLLSLSRVEMKENTYPTDLINISDSVVKAIKSNEWQASQKKMHIILEATPNLPLIIGDESDITQVVINLINNAIKYGHNDSNIIIATGVTEEIGKKKRIYISVTNNGEGIAEEDLTRITQRFYRVDRVRSQNISGAGLGLAIVKHILNRHHGDMIIASKLNEGSTFTVRLPIASKNQIEKIRNKKVKGKK